MLWLNGSDDSCCFRRQPNGIAKDMPKRKKKEKVTSQIYDKSGQTKLDHSAINRKIEQVNKRITKINRKYGHKDD